MKNINIYVLAFAALSLMQCKPGAESAPAEALEGTVQISDSSLLLMGVVLGAPEQKVVESRVYLNGKVVALPNYRASVSTDIEGKVERVFVREGDFVKQGQPLMSLRSMALIELQSEYLARKSEFDFLAIEFKRQEELIRQNVGALADFQTTEAKFKAAQSEVSALAAKLRLLGIDAATLNGPDRNSIVSVLTIPAPIDGFVFKLPVQVGMLASTNIVLTELINTDKLMADVFLYDNDLDDVHEGQPVEIDFVNHLYPSVQGTVERLSRAFDTETRAVTAHVSFQSPPGRLILPDMSVRCALIHRDSNIPKLTVPAGAILEEEDHQFVYVSPLAEKEGKSSRLHKMRVKLGHRNDKEVQIEFANPPQGDFLVVTHNPMIVENERKKRATR